jgi:hypothetical protein
LPVDGHHGHASDPAGLRHCSDLCEVLLCPQEGGVQRGPQRGGHGGLPLRGDAQGLDHAAQNVSDRRCGDRALPVSGSRQQGMSARHVGEPAPQQGNAALCGGQRRLSVLAAKGSLLLGSTRGSARLLQPGNLGRGLVGSDSDRSETWFRGSQGTGGAIQRCLGPGKRVAQEACFIARAQGCRGGRA